MITLRKLFICLLCLAAALSASAQQKYTPLPPHLDGSMMPFDFTTCTQPPYLPDSLTPVYVAYVARHGARFLSSPAKLTQITVALQQARNAGTLSDEGDDFFALTDEIREANAGNWGDLSPLGFREERKLADRICGILTPLSRHGVRVNAISSFVPRSVMTMYLLMNGIVRHNDTMTVNTDEGTQFDSLVCCFRSDTKYADFRKDGDWKPVYDDFFRRTVPTAPARRLFTTTSLSDDELRQLTFDMYEVLKANRAAGLPAPTTRWMSVREYEQCWKASNLLHYLRNTVSPVSHDAAVATTPLLRRLISDIDTAVSNVEPQLVLNGYFGHAETLLPLLSLIRLPGCFALPLDYDNLDKYWKIQNITPLGANLLILISRSESGRFYVAIQLNGRSIKPLRGKPDVVSWPELRQYWCDLIDAYAIPSR